LCNLFLQRSKKLNKYFEKQIGENIIYKDGLAIKKIDFNIELGLMLIVLNTKAVLQQQLSHYPLLAKAFAVQLHNYELIANGTGVHWPALDEGLRLKGFLQDEIRGIVRNNLIIVAYVYFVNLWRIIFFSSIAGLRPHL
jgi:hypothetical protein